MGVNPTEISDLIGIRLSEVQCIEEDNQRRRRFFMTGDLDLPGQMAGGEHPTRINKKDFNYVFGRTEETRIFCKRIDPANHSVIS